VALHYAASKGNRQIVEMLLARDGIMTNLRDVLFNLSVMFSLWFWRFFEIFQAPFSYALRRGDMDLAELLAPLTHAKSTGSV
jgi:hypothetical protein